jgi:hypothetical protein
MTKRTCLTVLMGFCCAMQHILASGPCHLLCLVWATVSNPDLRLYVRQLLETCMIYTFTAIVILLRVRGLERRFMHSCTLPVHAHKSFGASMGELHETPCNEVVGFQGDYMSCSRARLVHFDHAWALVL